MQWRVDSGADRRRRPRGRRHRRRPHARDARGRRGRQPVAVAHRHRQRRHHRAGQRHARAPCRLALDAVHRARRGLRRAGSGVDKIERTIDGGAVSEDPDVTISADGEHLLLTRIVDLVGNASAWRTDTIQIDSVAPVVGLACSPASGWSTHAVTCTVSADGGPSGLASLTASQDGGAAAPRSRTAARSTSARDGVHTVHLDGHRRRRQHRFRRRDRPGRPHRAHCDGHVRPRLPAPPTPAAPAAPTAPPALARSATASTAARGQAVPAAGSFTVAQGRRERARARRRRQPGRSRRLVTLADRTPASKPPGGDGRRARRSTSPATRTRAASSARCAPRAARHGTVSVDLRPLAVGRGKFRVQIKLTSGKRSRDGQAHGQGRQGRHAPADRRLPRPAASAKCTVTLTVVKRAGSHWRRYATSKVVLAG